MKISEDNCKVILWGTRGTLSSGNVNMIKYGCNTPCVSIECDGSVFVFDTGSGIVPFSGYYNEYLKNMDINIFISHYHIDHISGLPFFAPFYDKEVNILMHGRTIEEKSCKQILNTIFSPPYFPINLISENMKDRIKFNELIGGNKYTFNSAVTVETLNVNHPGISTAFKLNYKGKSICYLSDYEYDGDENNKVSQFIKGTDIVIIDSNYTQEDYKTGWGHSSWQNAVEFCEKQNIKQVVLFHHNYLKNDEELDKLQQQVEAISSNIYLAKDGLQFIL
jgi:phosphoribosyl 1,2-cyclic phosphodiesterase